MHSLKTLLAAVLAFGAVCAPASATVLDFETPGQLTNSGLTYSTMYRLQCSTYGFKDSGFCRGVASGDWIAYFSGTEIISKTGGRFTFNGAYLTSAWNDNMSVDVVGYRNNVAVFNKTIVISDDVATYFAFNYTNIDRLYLRAFGGTDAGTQGGGTHVAVDDFRFDEVALPEPASTALLGLGIAGLALARRRRAA